MGRVDETPSNEPKHAPPRRLVQATAAAAAGALVVLVVAVFPAEYGVDPTGIGRAFGFTRLRDSGEAASINESNVQTLFARDVRWVVEQETIHESSGFLAVADAQTFVRFPFVGTNLTRMSATLSWTDEAGTEPDEFEIQIRAPDGRASEYVSAMNPVDAAGRITTALQWRSAPQVVEANGTLSFPTAIDASAQGEWTVIIRIYWAGGSEERPGNEWSLAVVAQSFRFDRNAAIGDADAALDSVTLTLPPGRGVEYKFAMREGAILNFTWASTAPVTFDFHGDTEQTKDDPTSFKQGVAAGDQGRFPIPFTGRHGWWWYNGGTSSVTVTLQTAGDYDVIGVV